MFGKKLRWHCNEYEDCKIFVANVVNIDGLNMQYSVIKEYDEPDYELVFECNGETRPLGKYASMMKAFREARRWRNELMDSICDNKIPCLS